MFDALETARLEEIVNPTAILEQCPRCGAAGPDVYRAAAHHFGCAWSFYARRCDEHDELLRPDEPGCPHPEAPEDDRDPHGRRL